MLEKLFDLLTKVFTVTSRVDRLEKYVENLRRDVTHLAEIVNQQSAKIDILVYALQAENDKTKLWLERELARFERCLPEGKEDKNDAKD